MKTFISMLDRDGNLHYVKYYISSHEFGTAILTRYIAKYVLNKPLSECYAYITKHIRINPSNTRCYFMHDDVIYAANMNGRINDSIILSMPKDNYLIAIDNNGFEHVL